MLSIMNGSYEWAEFSSDSSDDESLASAMKKQPAQENNKGNNKSGNKIPPKKSNYSKSVICGGGKAKANARAKDDVKFQFGVDGCHKYKGKLRVASPKGAPMILSRRLSRRIMRASPLRSPIVACTLNFADSTKKATKKKKTAAKQAPPRRA